MSLAIRWPKNVPGGRVLDDFVSLTDIAPTLLEVVGVHIPEAMTGRSLWPLLVSGKSGRLDPERDFVITAFERHTWCRRNGVGYPMRAIRTYGYAYIRNYEPGRWPAGDPDFVSSHQGFYGDIDRGASKTYMKKSCDDPKVVRLFQLAFGRRPAEELYDMEKDPAQLSNLADDPAYSKVKHELAARLREYLTDHNDPRLRGESPWDTYPFYHKIINDPNWRTVGRKD